MGRTVVEVGHPCIATGGAIKMLTQKVFRFDYDDGIKYTFVNLNNDQVDLQNSGINFDSYVNRVCNIYGDFLPPKTTRTGKVKQKFLVLRIECVEVLNV